MKELINHTFKTTGGNEVTVYISDGKVLIKSKSSDKVFEVNSVEYGQHHRDQIVFGGTRGCKPEKWQDAEYVITMINTLKKSGRICMILETTKDRDEAMSSKNYGEEFIIGGNDYYVYAAYKYM
jgi:hypothetical protein